MRWEQGGRRARIIVAAWALATGPIGGAVRAQVPVLPAPAPFASYAPVAPPAPIAPPAPPCGTCATPAQPRPIQNAFHHAAFWLKDNMIGYPEEFIEPPVGFYVNTTYRQMRAKADPHRFTLYKTDFLVGSSRFSPTGATHFNLMASRIALAPGPILIEWSPDEPGLAEIRRAAVLSTFQQAGVPLGPDRVVIAPSPYPGGLGADSANYYNIMIQRDAQAPTQYSLTPTSASGFGSGGGGSR